MVEEKKTTSDEILAFVKKRQGDNSYIDAQAARELAQHSSDKIFRDLIVTKKMCDSNLVF